MPQYVMPIKSQDARKRFAALDSFTQGYIEAALWSGLSEDEEIEHFGGYAAFDDLAPGTVASMIYDCADFQASNAADLEQWGNDHQAGVDFWLTRNRHGAGFWDRGRGELGNRLTVASFSYGSCYLYVGDDGLIYVA